MKIATIPKLPHVLLILTVWIIARTIGFSTSIFSPIGIAILLYSFAALVMEFFKSGDIGLNTFGVDLALSVLQVVACSAAMTALIQKGLTVTIPDVALCAVVLADAWVSPVNSFRTALRNFATNNTGPSQQ